MPIPINPEDFSAIGARFQSEDIVSEIDRLVPLATADLAQLATRGYGPARLAQLNLHVPNQHMGRIEDAHMAMCHMIAYHFMEEAY